MIETPLSKTATVGEMILAELAASETPLTSGDLYKHLEIDHRDTVIHRALTSLLREGRVELGETVMGQRGQPAKTYRLPTLDSDSARLMTHLESELESSTALEHGDIKTRRITDEDGIPTIRFPLSAVLDDTETARATAPRCRSCGEFLEHPEITTCLECQIDTAEHEADARLSADPILTALDRMDSREPRFQEGHMHVNRIRAMATHLDEGRPILPQIDVIAYLFDLANTIEAMSS